MLAEGRAGTTASVQGRRAVNTSGTGTAPNCPGLLGIVYVEQSVVRLTVCAAVCVMYRVCSYAFAVPFGCCASLVFYRLLCLPNA